MASTDIVQSLRAKLAELERERKARKLAIDAEYTPAIARLHEALGQWNNGNSPVADQAPDISLSIGEDKLAAIRQFVLEHADEDGLVRQAEVAHMLEDQFGVTEHAASGHASTGMRRLWSEHLIEPAPKLRGSNAWRLNGLSLP